MLQTESNLLYVKANFFKIFRNKRIILLRILSLMCYNYLKKKVNSQQNLQINSQQNRNKKCSTTFLKTEKLGTFRKGNKFG